MKKPKQIIFLLSLCVLFAICAYAVVQVNDAAQSMPVIVIDPGEGASFAGKDYHTATITISYPGQMKDVVLSSNTRQRGNGTMNYDKKSYKIKLEDKYDLLLGEGGDFDNAARDWVLLANYFDRSNLRNYYMFWTASQLDGLNYVSDCTFVEVYLIDEFGEKQYQGVYLLCEQVEVDEARIDIDDTTDGDKGFLVELVQDEAKKQDYHVRVSHDGTEQVYDIRSNIDRETEDETLARIQGVLEDVEAALATGDQAQIEAVIDIDSCVDMYILQEYMLNVDVGWGSFYLYCHADEEQLYFSPPWDFDRSAGADWRLFYTSYEGIYVGSETTILPQNNLWYQDLMQMEWFQQLVKERWNETKYIFLEGITEIEGVAQTYSTQFDANYALWCEGQDPDEYGFVAGESYADDAAYLAAWLQNRYTWLDEYFNTQL